MPSKRRIWFLARVGLYLLVIALLLRSGGTGVWGNIRSLLTSHDASRDSLVICGRSLAPVLIDQLVASYREDYPRIEIQVHDGGTNQALEDLINGRCQAAFLLRPPTVEEQDLFRDVTGDTAIFAQVAVGAVLVAAPLDYSTEGLTPDDLRRALQGRQPGLDILFLPDPNQGLLSGLCRSLGITEPPASSPHLVYLADQAAILDAVAGMAGRSATRAWGLIGRMDLPDSDAPATPRPLRFLTAKAAPESCAVAPTYENTATGRYPFHNYLYVACRGADDRAGGHFLTSLVSARGMRQVARAGFIPARNVAREITLSRDPLGG